MGLAAFISNISNIWTGFSPPPKQRRAVYIDPDSIEPINHWFPGNRNKKQPRRLVETPTAGHWPEHRVAKRVVAKGRKRCKECGALTKEAQVSSGKGVVRVGEKGSSAGKKLKKVKKGKAAGGAVRSLRGRVVEYSS